MRCLSCGCHAFSARLALGHDGQQTGEASQNDAAESKIVDPSTQSLQTPIQSLALEVTKPSLDIIKLQAEITRISIDVVEALS
jgi:hypothetical protein